MDKQKWWNKSSVVLRFCVFVLATALTGVVIYLAFSPLGAAVNYSVVGHDSASGKIRTLNPFGSEVVVRQTGSGMELKSSSAKMTSNDLTVELRVPFQNVKRAHVKIKYRFQQDPRAFYCGFILLKRSNDYNLQAIQMPGLDLLGWNRVEQNGLALLQKEKVYESVQQFLDALPTFKKSDPSGGQEPSIGAYGNYVVQPQPDIDISKVNRGTTIDATVRGKHEAHVYVKDKPLELNLKKLDMNLAVGEDHLKIKVFSEEKEVETLLVPDDGNMSADHNLTGPEKVRLYLPGLEEGSYMIQFECSDDVLMQDIKSQQRYLVFSERVFLADNQVYGAGPSKPVTLHSNTNKLVMTPLHPEALQTVIINGKSELSLNVLYRTFLYESSDPITEVTTEKGGVTIASDDKVYFAFDKSSFYDPFPVIIEDYSPESDILKLDMIVTTYASPEKEGDWYSRELTFDMEDAVVEENYLNFKLACPGLVDSGNSISIQSLEIRLEKAD